MIARYAAILLVPLLLVPFALALAAAGGCQQPDAVHDDHLEHHVPEHKPPDLRAAIDEIERRWEAQGHAELIHAEVATKERTAKLKELVDIVRWLPEIAGDSDLPEPEWNVVDQVSGQLTPLLLSQWNRAQRGVDINLQPLHAALDSALARLRAAAGKLPMQPGPARDETTGGPMTAGHAAGERHEHGQRQGNDHD